jgi:hypothetical protein
MALEAEVKELEMKEALLLPAVQQYEICRESLARSRTSLAKLRNRRLPISRLPDDVLALIFEAGGHYDPVVDNFLHNFHEWSADGYLPFAVLVSHVSSTWRNVAIQDPFLWTEIGFIYSRPWDFYLMYVNRSKSCSLDIHFICDVERAPDFDPSILQLHRCRHLEISSRWYRSAFHIFRNLENEIAPHLLSLIIHMGYAKDEFDSFSHKHYELFRSAAPLLSSVEMLGISLHSCQPPLGALTMLDMTVWDSTPALSCDELLEVFAAMAPTLTDLRLEGIIFRVESGYELFAIDFPALVSMDIRYPDYFDEEEGEDEDDRNYISNLWDCINAPALESLRLDCIDDEQFHAVMASLRRQRVSNATAGLKSLRLFNSRLVTTQRTSLWHVPIFPISE